MERNLLEKKCDYCGETETFDTAAKPRPSIESWITLVTFKLGPEGVRQVQKQACKTSCAINVLKTVLGEKMGVGVDVELTAKGVEKLKEVEGQIRNGTGPALIKQ